MGRSPRRRWPGHRRTHRFGRPPERGDDDDAWEGDAADLLGDDDDDGDDADWEAEERLAEYEEEHAAWAFDDEHWVPPSEEGEGEHRRAAASHALMPDDPPAAAPHRPLLLHPPDGTKAMEWLAVLGSQGIDYEVDRRGGAWRIVVSPGQRQQAAEQLAAFEAESRHWPPAWSLPGSEGQEISLLSVVVALGLVGWFMITGGWTPGVRWFEQGAMVTEAVLGGELWRAATALTLHADFGHVAGNALCLALIGGVVCRRSGEGLGWLLMVLAGIAGNLATATAYQTGHANVGASTAVFGAMGLLAAWRLMDHLRWHGPLTLRGVGLPLILLLAAVGLMSAGPQVDWLAHLFGALAGLLLGIPTHRLFHHRRQWAWQVPAALAAAGLILVAWLLALR